jgi:hypothetical protein
MLQLESLCKSGITFPVNLSICYKPPGRCVEIGFDNSTILVNISRNPKLMLIGDKSGKFNWENIHFIFS